MCPPDARVCAWVKPIGARTRTNGIHSTWEPLIVVGGRQRPPGRRDWLSAAPARAGGSDVPGRKPLAFCAWLFGLLGMSPGDELVDLFPGSGGVARAWAEVSSGAGASLLEARDASLTAVDDASSLGAQGDAPRTARRTTAAETSNRRPISP